MGVRRHICRGRGTPGPEGAGFGRGTVRPLWGMKEEACPVRKQQMFVWGQERWRPRAWSALTGLQWAGCLPSECVPPALRLLPWRCHGWGVYGIPRSSGSCVQVIGAREGAACCASSPGRSAGSVSPWLCHGSGCLGWCRGGGDHVLVGLSSHDDAVYHRKERHAVDSRLSNRYHPSC